MNTKFTKVLALLLSFAMLISLVPATAITAFAAETNVAKIGDTEYATLANAITEAKAGNTITLIADVNENVTISKDLTIDGADKNYSGTITMNSGKTNTIQNVNFVKGNVYITNGNAVGVYTIQNCSFDGQKAVSHAIQSARAHSLTVEDCTIKNYSYSFLYANLSTPTINISNVTVENVSYASRVVSGATIKASKLTVKNANYGLVLDANGAKPTTLENCTFENVASPIYPNGSPANHTLTFKGVNEMGVASDFSSFKSVTIEAQNGTKFGDLAAIAAKAKSGDTIKLLKETNETIELPYGLILDKNSFEAPNVTVEKPAFVAMIGEAGYATLAEAIAAATAGQTVTFFTDITENVTVDKNITINGAGYTYTGKMTVSDSKVVSIQNVNFVKGYIEEASGAHGTLAIDGCTFDGVDKSIGYAIKVQGGDALTITNSSAKNYSTGMLYVPSAVTAITISNVKVANVTAAFNITYSGNALFENVSFENVAYGIHFQIHKSGSRTYTVKNSDLSGATNPFWFWDKSNGTEKVTVVFEGDNIVPMFQNPIPAGALILASGTLTAPEGLTIGSAVEGYVAEYENGAYTLVEDRDPSGYVAYRADVTDKADREGIAILLKGVYAKKSVVVKVYNNETLMFVCTRLDIDDEGKVMFPVDGNTTANIVLWGKPAGSWANEILVAPTELNVPNKIEVYADNVLVSTYTHESGTILGTNLNKYLALDCVENAAAQVGETKYMTLDEAIKAATAGQTITLLADVTEDVTIDKKLTINGADKTFTGKMTLKADTTIKNVNFDGKGYNGYAVVTGGANYVTIEDCTAENYGYGFVQLSSGTALTTVKNVKVSNMNYGVKVDYSNAVVLDNVDITVGVAAVLNSNYGEKTITIKNSKLNILGTWTRNNTTKTTYVFEGNNTVAQFKTDAAIDTFKLAADATLTAPAGLKVTATSGKVIYKDGKYSVLAGLAGSGTQADPYKIGSVEELEFFRDSVNAGETKYNAPGVYVVLTADIDLAGENWVAIGSAYQDHGFMGNFDGNGFKIKNLTIDNPALDSDGYAYAGFFGVTEGIDQNNQNTIKNLVIENVTISTTGHIVAGAIAYPYYTILENITVCGNIAIKGGNYTTGVLAYTRRCTTASNITISGNAGSYITGAKTVGGVISDIQMNGGLTANYSNFSASGLTITGDMHVGGISGIIAKQKLDGATVENVELVCSDARVGIFSGSMGDVSTISAATYANVTGATAEVGANYKTGAPIEAKAGNTYYMTFAEALAAANGDVITLFAPIEINEDTTFENITVDGNGVYPAFRVQNGATLTLNNCNIYNATDYVFTVGSLETAGKLVINGGSYKGQTTVANVVNGTLTILDGKFSVYDSIYGATYLLNCYDASAKDGSAKILVLGGEFVGFNPANNAAEGAGTNFCAPGYTAKADGDVYTVEAKAVAKIASKTYTSLAEAVAAAKAGQTITLISDAYGAGVVIDKNLTIDFAGYTYTLTSGVGSKGTESNGFQILAGNKVIMKKGTLTVADFAAKQFYILVQNYADLEVFNMTLDGTNLDKWSMTDGDSYTLSNNSGNVTVTGSTKIIANNDGDKAFAFDVCAYANYALPTVTVYTTAKIEGAIEAPVKVSKTYYATLQQAIDAADEGATITLLGDVEGAGVVINKGLTINFNGFTYSLTSGVGSGTITSNGFQILTGNKVILKSGTLKVADKAADKFYILVQNYADLEVFNMTLDGTNLDKWSKTDGDSYTLSNNSGKVTLTGSTKIIANNDGDKAFAFDVCAYANYELPVVTVYSTVKIEGAIEAPAKVGNVYYATFEAAYDVAAAQGKTLYLVSDLHLTKDDVVKTADGLNVMFNFDKNVTLDLAGATIYVDYDNSELLYAVMYVEDGVKLSVINSDKTKGGIELTTGDTLAGKYDCVAYMFWKRGTTGNLYISGGKYHANKLEDSMVYTNANCKVTIAGGTFILDNVGTGANQSPWIFNTQGQNEKKIVVTGGTFNADVFHQHWFFEVSASEKLALKNNGDGTYTVVEAVAYVNEQYFASKWYTKNVGYATIEEAEAAAKGQKERKVGNKIYYSAVEVVTEIEK